MRLAELAFLVLLVLYHVFLLVPRHRRFFPANYLVFLAGMALAWNLGLEGLRWQTIPPTLLLLLDLTLLFPTFATLRGVLPKRGFWSGSAQVLRTLLASVAFLVAAGCALLAVAFPLPRVELTGGLPPAYRVVRFPATAGQPGVQLHLWYPASGVTRTAPRPGSLPEHWRTVQALGGVPVFYQSHLEHLPSSLVLGGKTASPGTQYPVIYVALPANEDPSDFGYAFEDLASRGFLVAAGGPLPPPSPAAIPFGWSAALVELTRPLTSLNPWLEPDLTYGGSQRATDYRWIEATKRALSQLSAEPGDLLFGSVDEKRQGLWAYGSGTPPANLGKTLELRGMFHAGEAPAAAPRLGAELWLTGGSAPAPVAGRWVLAAPQFHRADLADAAYLKPYLAFVGLKSQADAGFHGAFRQYQAAFFQNVFWEAESSFGQSVPQVPGLTLSGR